MSVVISIQVCSHIPCICHTIIQCLSLYGKDDWIDKHVWHFTHIGQIKPSIPFLFVFSHWCFVPGHKGKIYIRLLVSWGWDISQSITSIVCESVTNKTLSSTIRLWYASRNNVWAGIIGGPIDKFVPCLCNKTMNHTILTSKQYYMVWSINIWYRMQNCN